jgi:hypothetical protein
MPGTLRRLGGSPDCPVGSDPRLARPPAPDERYHRCIAFQNRYWYGSNLTISFFTSDHHFLDHLDRLFVRDPVAESQQLLGQENQCRYIAPHCQGVQLPRYLLPSLSPSFLQGLSVRPVLLQRAFGDTDGFGDHRHAEAHRRTATNDASKHLGFGLRFTVSRAASHTT